MTGFAFAYAVVRVCGGQPRKNPGAPIFIKISRYVNVIRIGFSNFAASFKCLIELGRILRTQHLVKKSDWILFS